jgi:hypothetical protein
MYVKIGALFTGLALSTLIAWPARAEVPTAADFAACNMKAAEEAASDAVSASPRTEAAPRAGQLPPDARPKPSAPVLRDPTGTTLSSDKDPQINGMAADRANDRAYVAAYRSCMRQKGF